MSFDSLLRTKGNINFYLKKLFKIIFNILPHPKLQKAISKSPKGK